MTRVFFKSSHFVWKGWSYWLWKGLFHSETERSSALFKTKSDRRVTNLLPISILLPVATSKISKTMSKLLYLPFPHGPWRVISSLDEKLMDISTLVNKITVSKFKLDVFARKGGMRVGAAATNQFAHWNFSLWDILHWNSPPPSLQRIAPKNFHTFSYNQYYI